MSSKDVRRSRNKTKTDAPQQGSDWPLLVFFSLMAAFFTTAFFFWTLIPFLQMNSYLEAIRTGRVQKILKTDFIFSPYTVAQRVIRYEFLKYLEDQNVDARGLSLLNGAITKMEESVEKEGSSPYQYIRLGRAFERKVEILGDPAYFQQADAHYKKAIALSPQRQEAYYAYGLSLIRQGHKRAEEAVFVLTKALDKNLPISYFYLGLAEFNLGKNSYSDTLNHLEFFFDQSLPNPDQKASQDVYANLFHFFYGAKDLARASTVAARIVHLDGDSKGLYRQVLDSINKNKQLPPLQFNGHALAGIGG